jgi:uncharacterized protein
MANPLLVNAAELLRRPGTDKPIALNPTVAELDIDDARLPGDGEIEVALRLESLSDGVVVDGEIRVPWAASCRRCLEPATGVTISEVHELYQTVVTDPDAFPIVGDQIDLRPLVRDLALLDAPLAPLCSAECAGLCPVCGSNRNTHPCRCDTSTVDPRWAGLAGLRLDD